jgi:phospholipase/lecithinase/hemolysin
MNLWTARAIVFAAALICSPAEAATLDYFSSFHVFGDSLSDRGNVYHSTFGRLPESPPYWNGRFSNGPVWAEHVQDEFKALDIPTGNHAWGGARADGGSDLNPDLGLQVSRYRLIDEDRRGDRPLAAIFIGANDFLEVSGDDDARAAGKSAARSVGDAADSLTRAGVDDFLMFYLPDLGKVPKYASDPEDSLAATEYTRGFNRRLRREMNDLQDDGASVTRVNTLVLFNAMIADPEAYGVRNTTDPCLNGNDVCSDSEARDRAFFDELHPNYVVHERIAEAALAAISASGLSSSIVAATAGPTPVPLPAPAWLLAGGLIWLGMLSRRRRAA